MAQGKQLQNGLRKWFDFTTVEHSFSSWPLHRLTLQIAPAIAGGMLLWAGFMEACSSVLLQGQSSADILV